MLGQELGSGKGTSKLSKILQVVSQCFDWSDIWNMQCDHMWSDCQRWQHARLRESPKARPLLQAHVRPYQQNEAGFVQSSQVFSRHGEAMSLPKALQILQALLAIPTESELGIDALARLIAPEKAGLTKSQDSERVQKWAESSSTPALFSVFSVYGLCALCVD